MRGSDVALADASPVPKTRAGRVGEAAFSAACTGSIILWRPDLPALLCALLASAAAVSAIDLARREYAAPSRVVPLACVIAVLFALAVARSPAFPTDVRAYAADGRILAQYHRNPYVATPNEFVGDPVFAHVRNATAPYGPLFIGPAAVVAKVAGTDELRYRLFYQVAAALAIGGALALLWRSRRSTAAIVLVGLHPVVAGIIVNGGHNDAFVGLALLAAALAAERKRFLAVGTVVAGAMLVKITAGLALVPLAAWAAHKGGRRVLLGLVGPALVLVVPTTLIVPGLLRSVRAANIGLVTRTSIWNLYPLRAPLLAKFGDGAVTQLGLASIGVALVFVALSDWDLTDKVAGSLAAWLVLSAYVMPWYTVWALPVAALHPRHPVARLVAWQGAIVVAAFLLPQRLLANHLISFSVGWIAPLALLWMFIRALGTRGRVTRLDSSPAPT